MRKICIIVVLCLSLQTSAQIGVKLIQFRPVDEFGMVMSKQFSGELMYQSEFDDSRRFRFGLGYVPFSPRLDTFPVVAYEDGNGLKVLPGYEVFHKYNMMYLFGGMDYAFWENDSWFAYGGLDLIGGGIDKDYDLYYATLSDEHNSGGEKLAGGRLRVGGQYMLSEHAGINLEFARAYYWLEEDGWFSHNEIGIGFQYIFD